MSIDKIRNIGLDKLVTQVYDFDSLTTDELMCKFAQKINIIIEHFNYLDKECQNNNENIKLKLDYLLGQGLEEQVAKRLLELINNGTLGKLINESLLKDINDKVGALENNVDLNNEKINDIINAVGNIVNDSLPDLENIKVYSNNVNNVITTATKGVGNNVVLDGLNVNGTETETFTVLEDKENITLKNSKINANNMAIHINANNAKNINIANNDLTGTDFPVLINENSKNGENANILFNNIKAQTGDGIEINTPSEAFDTFKIIKIIGNTVLAQGDADNTTRGFGIGIAQGHDVTVLGNIVKDSPRESLHIEDCSENVTVVGNVFNSSLDGCRILTGNKTTINPKLYGKTVLINGNHFKKNGVKNYNGIWIIKSDLSIPNIINISNNRIEGFATGLNIDGENANIECNGTVIENCTKGLVTSGGNIKGNIYMDNCGSLLECSGNSTVDNIICQSYISPENLIINNMTISDRITVLRGLEYKQKHLVSTDAENFTYVKLLPINKCNGKISIRIISNSICFNTVFDLIYNGTNLTATENINFGYGAIGTPLIVNQDGYLTAKIYADGLVGKEFEISVNFKGNYFISKA